MASTHHQFNFLKLLLLLLPIFTFAQNVRLGSSLTANTNNNASWKSPSGDFAFGFRPLENNLFLLSIWYDKIPDKTVVWYADSKSESIPMGSKAELTTAGKLLLTNPQGKTLWEPESVTGSVTYAAMLDTGNFVLSSGNGNPNSWESFKYPTDTILPTQIMQAGDFLYSRQSEKNYTKGRFRLRVLDTGNFVINPVASPSLTENDYEAYYNLNWLSNSVNPEAKQFVFNKSGDIYIVKRNGSKMNLTWNNIVPVENVYYRATLDFDGVFVQYSHPIGTYNGTQRWSIVRLIPDNICVSIIGRLGSGACGYNSYCVLTSEGRPSCECPPRYVLVDPNNRFGGCRPNFMLQGCQEEDLKPDLFELQTLKNVDWPTADYDQLNSYNEQDCRSSCLNDCLCAVAIYREGTCWKKKLPLPNGRFDSAVDGNALIKIRKGGRLSGNPISPTLALGSSLTAATNNNASWKSPSGEFAFGFRPVENNLFLLSIWYDKIPDKTVVWYADSTESIPIESKIELTTAGKLLLTNPQGKKLWEPESITDPAKYVAMLDNGNFVLASDSGNVNFDYLWESFKYPTDTILPTQNMEVSSKLYSRQSEKNYTRGRFRLHVDRINFVLYPVAFPGRSENPYDAYYNLSSITNDLSEIGRLVFRKLGDIYIERKNGSTTGLTWKNTIPVPEVYYRATLDFDGIFTQYSHPKTSNGRQQWSIIRSIPDNICHDIAGRLGSGACGYNSYCALTAEKRSSCACPPGYVFVDPNNIYGDCRPEFILPGCHEEDPKNPDLFELQTLQDVDWPTSVYEELDSYNEQDCRASCLNDCLCAVALHRKSTCWKKKLPLQNGRHESTAAGNALIKVRKDNGSLGKGDPNSPTLGLKKERFKLSLVNSLLLGSSVFFIFLAAIFLVLLYMDRKLRKKNQKSSVLKSNLRSFTYQELEEATDRFKEELGRGAFGIVYKGVIEEMGTETDVAVKKLDKVIRDGEKEFIAEVSAIGRSHHKNLVRLLGFCEEGLNRLLVYEFMSNGSLAQHLFGISKPDWNQRVHIGFGIARGLMYLHGECSTQIIHCDIKPQNILLEQTRTSTGIRGTRGYVAPEWFRNVPVSTKIDVYSYGVMLLEIICCRKGVDMSLEEDNDRTILTDWAYDSYRKRKLEELIENDEDATNDMKSFERLVMIAIWCIQEEPALRPSMKKVTQMLEGVIEVCEPPCPCPYTTFFDNDNEASYESTT